MTREQAVRAYQRVTAMEREISTELRERILVRIFAGCGCRMHNCRVNFESGFDEGSSVIDGVTYTHADLARQSRRYDHEQRQIWDKCEALHRAFARWF